MVCIVFSFPSPCLDYVIPSFLVHKCGGVEVESSVEGQAMKLPGLRLTCLSVAPPSIIGKGGGSVYDNL
jgi:hypothetical protein